jgi:hypothetical protein
MDTCPYQLIVQTMPFPFALFRVRDDDWVLTSFNKAFQEVTNCRMGDSVVNFRFDPKELKSEFGMDDRWYLAYSFLVSKSQLVVIMNDITEKHTFEEAISQIVLGAAAVL